MIRRNLSITSYLAFFVVLGIVPIIIFALTSTAEAERIKRQAMENQQLAAKQDFLLFVSHLVSGIDNLSKTISEWDETLGQFDSPIYYEYWKQNRVLNNTHLQLPIAMADLYTQDGKILAQTRSFFREVQKDAISSAIFFREQGKIYLNHVHPIYLDEQPKQKPSGYLSISIDVNAALEKDYARHSFKIESLKWNIAEGEKVNRYDILSHVNFDIYQNYGITALSVLVNKIFALYFVYSIAILACFSFLLHTSLGRPLKRLAFYLKNTNENQTTTIPDFQGIIKIKELDAVRQAVNEHRDRIILAQDDLVKKNEELLVLTYQDTLTGIGNRRAFETRIKNALLSSRINDSHHSLCYLDLDQFKVVNDTCGHAAGDELLRQLANQLKAHIRESDTLARLGGDEFGVLLENCQIDRAMQIAEELRQTVKDFRFIWEDKLFEVGVSIGLVAITKDSTNLNEILRSADAACYEAKDRGRNRVYVYKDDDKGLEQRHGEMEWISRITLALEEDRFLLFQQPIHSNIHSGEEKFEILIRMKNEEGQIIPPMSFCPAAERYYIMPTIDKWVISSLLESLRKANYPLEQRDSLISINISGQSIGDENFLPFVQDQLATSGISPRHLCFEITETAAITNFIAATQFIRTLKQLGCKFALDDFGSGLSSFGYLKSLDVDFIKIDGYFVKNMLQDPVSFSIVESINRIAHVIGIQTIAEFVENDSTIARIRNIGIDYSQGFAIGKPAPLSDLLMTSSQTRNPNVA